MPLTKVSSGVIAANAVVDSFGTQSITGDKLGLTAINANNIVNASITGAKIALGTITGDDIATGQITGNLLTANCVSGNNIVSSPTITGNVTINGSLGIGGATPASSGFGITFPATQVTSADANTLDDYEEGTWTVAIQGSSTDPTVGYNFRYATYVKVGRLVTLNFHLRTSSVSGGSGDVWFTGLPFAVDNTSSYTTVGPVYQFGTNGNYSTFARLDNGSTHLDTYYGSYNVQATQFAVSDLADGAFRNETAVTISYLATA